MASLRYIASYYDTTIKKVVNISEQAKMLSLLGHWLMYLMLTYATILKFQRIWVRLLYLLAKVFLYQSSVLFYEQSEGLSWEKWVASLSLTKRNAIINLLLNFIVFIVLTIGNNISMKQILQGFVERAAMQAENQAILETMEVGIISVSKMGIKYFNVRGEKTLVKAIMELDKDFATKQRCMQEIKMIQDDISKCKPHA